MMRPDEQRQRHDDRHSRLMEHIVEKQKLTAGARTAASGETPVVRWVENGEERSAAWRSEAGVAVPKRVQLADDTLNADTAYRLACEGTALLWRGDFQNARQLLQAMARRLDRKPGKSTPAKSPPSVNDAFNRHRMAQAQRARTLGMLLIPFGADHVIALRRAPDARQACAEAYGEAAAPYVASLRELLGAIGAHEWRKKGVEIPALAGRIHPHYGVFSPVRGEYVAMVASAPLPAALAENSLAFDVGTGTGVLSAVLARRAVADDISLGRLVEVPLAEGPVVRPITALWRGGARDPSALGRDLLECAVSDLGAGDRRAPEWAAPLSRSTR